MQTRTTILFFFLAFGMPTFAAENRQQTQWQSEIVPLIRQHCSDCHKRENAEAEIDFSAYVTIDQIRADLGVWIRTRRMIRSEQMPPPEESTLTSSDRNRLLNWIEEFLAEEAKKHAGDPGPVTLRRLNNVEYTYSIRDLTGVHSLDPADQFPVDGAAGEGFTNVGDALPMSPSLLTKYMDAAKRVSQHAVLLPDGLSFSTATTRPDRTNLWLEKIRSVYDRSSVEMAGKELSLQGVNLVTNKGGRLDSLAYFKTLLKYREQLRQNETTLPKVAAESGVNPKYLAMLWSYLENRSPNAVNQPLIARWRSASENDAATLVSSVKQWQDRLWKFNIVGHLGRAGSPTSWMEEVDPVVEQVEIDWTANNIDDAAQVASIYLSIGNAGDKENVPVVIDQLRIEGGSLPSVMMSKATPMVEELERLRRNMLERADVYLAAASELPETSMDAASKKHNINAAILASWQAYLALPGPVQVTGHYRQKLEIPNYDFVKGWGTHQTPSVIANSSNQQVRIPGISPGGSITVHPSPTRYTAVGWQSPINGKITIEANVSDAHPECGNGVTYFLQHLSGSSASNLWRGEIERAGKSSMNPKSIHVTKGEVIAIMIGPRNGNHACDLTQVNLTITDESTRRRKWDASQDLSSDIQQQNPHPDREGNLCWHFYHGLVSEIDSSRSFQRRVPPGSLLAQWLETSNPDLKQKLALKIKQLLTEEVLPPSDADKQMLGDIRALPIPVDQLNLNPAKRDARFGATGNDLDVGAESLLVKTPSVIRFELPADLVRNRRIRGTARIAHSNSKTTTIDGSAQLRLSLDDQPMLALDPTRLILASGASLARLRRDLREFGDLFPPALCYRPIVPIDEVVTLVLFHREDEHLKRLMLNRDQAQTLDRLWDELLFISQEPLKLVVAHEQISEFATQDRPDLVKAFAPMKAPIADRANQFRERLLQCESIHLDAVVDFARDAWRRPLTEIESKRLRSFYHELRAASVDHEQSIRMCLARVLASPTFLYRRERQLEDKLAHRVTQHELATRLSYFLWSTTPNRELQDMANNGQLTSESLGPLAERMLADQKTRRFAVQFFCQWLHVRDFDQYDAKNESLYPEFGMLRESMYEETIRFFTELVRRNRSILDMLDSQYTYLNEPLAKHYGIPDVHGVQFRQVQRVDQFGRGGVITMASALSTQSGASRTSPILRGNWIYETLLGRQLPKPPSDVPELPPTIPAGLSAREVIAKHSQQRSCAKCHRKIDPLGFALEGFDAIGRPRPKKGNTATVLEDGTSIDGAEELKHYLLTMRRDEFVEQFCRKLLGYALGREVLLSDEPLIDEMTQQLRQNEYRFNAALGVVVSSPQFQQTRGARFPGHRF